MTAIDVAESRHDRITVDVTCSAVNGEHADEIVAALGAVDGVTVHKVSDRTFLLHIGGKIEIQSKVPLRTRDDLSMAYTPGVARVCLALARNPDDVRRLTVKGNTVAVVTDGTAVLGLGDLGPGAALPVMEGKAALFKRFAGIDAWPICLDTTDVDEIVAVVKAIAPGFGGINLEDISAPRCFEVERRLRELLDIPVFHDDQHGTAIVVLAALTNALRCVGKAARRGEGRGLRGRRGRDRGGRPAAGGRRTAAAGLGQGGHPLAHRRPAVRRPSGGWPSGPTPAGLTGELPEALDGADVVIGVSAAGVIDPAWLSLMAPQPVVFALANPDPEVDVDAAREVAAVVATGRSDYPNQINNVLAFPGRLPRAAGRAGAATSPPRCCCPRRRRWPRW